MTEKILILESQIEQLQREKFELIKELKQSQSIIADLHECKSMKFELIKQKSELLKIIKRCYDYEYKVDCYDYVDAGEFAAILTKHGVEL